MPFYDLLVYPRLSGQLLSLQSFVCNQAFSDRQVFVPVSADYMKAHGSQKDQFLCYGYYKYTCIYVILRYPNLEELSTEELLVSQGRKTFYLETLYINYYFLFHSLLLETFA